MGLECRLNVHVTVDEDEHDFQPPVPIRGGNEPQCWRVGLAILSSVLKVSSAKVVKALLDLSTRNMVLLSKLYKYGCEVITVSMIHCIYN